jgi:hypothetical protein
MDINISKTRMILQPIMQILIFITLYTIVWNFLYSFNFLKKHELWDLTTIYLFGCFTIVSLISGILILFLKRISVLVFIFLIILFAALTFRDFLSSPKIILLTWIEAGISILISNLVFTYFVKNNNK